MALIMYSILWFLFLVVIFDNSFEVIDPCASTPSIGVTSVFCAVPIASIGLFLFLYFLAWGQRCRAEKLFYSAVVLFFIPMLGAFVGYELLDAGPIRNLAMNTRWGGGLYAAGCYGDLTISHKALYLLDAIVVLVLSFVLSRLAKGRMSKS